MDKLKVIKPEFKWGKSHLKEGIKNLDDDDVNWLIQEIETLRLDNTYLQQRLKREVEK